MSMSGSGCRASGGIADHFPIRSIAGLSALGLGDRQEPSQRRPPQQAGPEANSAILRAGKMNGCAVQKPIEREIFASAGPTVSNPPWAHVGAKRLQNRFSGRSQHLGPVPTSHFRSPPPPPPKGKGFVGRDKPLAPSAPFLREWLDRGQEHVCAPRLDPVVAPAAPQRQPARSEP